MEKIKVSSEWSPNKYNELLELSPQAIFEIDVEGNLLIANSKFCAILDPELNSPPKGSIYEFADSIAFKSLLKNSLSKGRGISQIQFKTSAGHSFLEVTCHPKPAGFLCFATSMSDQLRLDSMQDLIMSSQSTGVWEHNLETGNSFWSKGYYALFNLDPNDSRSVAEIWTAMISRETSLRIAALMQDCALQPGSQFETTFKASLVDGGHKYIVVRGESVPSHNLQRSSRMRGVAFDITALEEANLRLKLTLETLKIGIWEYSTREQKLNWTPKQYQIFGTSPSEFDRSLDSFMNLIHPEDRQTVMDKTSQSLASGADYNLRFRINHRDKGVRHIRTRAFAERNKDGEISRMVGINWDITEEVERGEELEAQRVLALNQARLVTIGEMSAGIAHEINNPLAIILGNAEYLLDSLQKANSPDQDIHSCKKIIETTDRIHKIVKSLRAISRNVTVEHEAHSEKVSLGEILDESLALVEDRLTASNIALVKKGFDQSPLVECRPTEILQVFINLLNNSVDAIKNMPNPWIELCLFIKQDKVTLHFTDCGKGISPEIASQIMSPFFSTKASHEGTGLGLSISESILKAHSGSLSLDKLHPYTRFTIVLPLHQEQSQGSLT